MTDYAKQLEFLQLELECQRRSLEAAKNSPFVFLNNATGFATPEPATDNTWQPLLFAPYPGVNEE
jgi:hypothetical protein